MANILSRKRLLGFNDFFPNETPHPKEYYASKVGKDIIEKTTPFFLSFLRFGGFPEVEVLLKEWFTFYKFTYDQSVYYWQILGEYNRIKNFHPNEQHSLLAVESLLNILLWAQNIDIPASIERVDASATLPFFEFLLIFNDDVLKNYQRASDTVKQYDDNKQLQRIILAQSFSQSDLINIDYAQLLFTQVYKKAKLLKFLETKERYTKLLDTLLKEFNCNTKEEFLKAIGSAVFTALKPDKPSWTVLTLNNSDDKEKGKIILENLSIDENGVYNIEQDDYIILRNKPFQKINENEYRIIFELFLIKKLYNGLIFKLSSFDKNFLGDIRKDFSEGILVYEILNSILKSESSVIITGEEFEKKHKLEREPDFYFRNENKIVLFESKDFFIPGKIKLSYDFNLIEAELMKEGRLKKAVKQLVKNIERSILLEIPSDNLYDIANLEIYPVIVVHDSLYSAPALNYWVYYWFIEELKLNELINPAVYNLIAPITIIEIDTLILYEKELLNSYVNLINIIKRYHLYVRFDLGGKLPPDFIEAHAFKSAISFSEFVRDYSHQQGIEINFDTIETLLREYGIT